MAFKIEVHGKRAYAIGNTFPIKDKLRAAGCRWDPESKSWWIKVTEQEVLEALLNDLPECEPVDPNEPLVAIDGNTYPVREELRALGGRFDRATKTWSVPASRAERARELVKNAPKDTRPHYTRCKHCGAQPNARGWPKIYRNGVCSDCYREENG